MLTDQRSKPHRPLTGPVVADLAARSTPLIAAMDAQWAATVLAGQAITHADGCPWCASLAASALVDVLEMTGLTDAPVRFGRQA